MLTKFAETNCKGWSNLTGSGFLLFFFPPHWYCIYIQCSNILPLCWWVVFQFCSCWQEKASFSFLKYIRHRNLIRSQSYMSKTGNWKEHLNCCYNWWMAVKRKWVEMLSNPASYLAKKVNAQLIQSKVKSEGLQGFTLWPLIPIFDLKHV